MKTYMLLIVGLCSCCPDYNPCSAGMPNQCIAEHIVWNEVYKETIPAPSVRWVTHVEDGDGNPKDGVQKQRCDNIELKWFDGWHGYTSLIYAHELLHSHLMHKYGDGDGGHTRKDMWGGVTPDGWQIRGLLDDAFDALELGMPDDVGQQ